MQLQSAKIQNFRNYKFLELQFSEHLNIFIGDNGQGKTNLLEAIYLTTSGESFRDIEDYLTLKNSSEINATTRIRGLYLKNQKTFLTEINLNEKKRILVNEKLSSSRILKKEFPSIVFSPDSLEVIKESSDKRRQLIDQSLSLRSESYPKVLADYRKILKMRNRVLKEKKEERQSLTETEELLAALGKPFLELATNVTLSRINFITELHNDFNNAIQYILGSKNVDISVDYWISKEKLIKASWDQIYHLIQKRMNELLSAELSTGVTLVGPQRHDINFIFNQKDSRFYCSQGQQRAIILSFKVAQIMNYKKNFGYYPLLLLDDVLSELDIQKQSALVSFLHEVRTQVFLTTTDVNLPNLFRMDSLKVFKIKEGQIV